MDDALKYMDFVEGSMDEDAIEQFAQEFASDSEFRIGFQNFLLITNIMRNEGQSVQSPPELTKSIFKKLGLKTAEEMELEELMELEKVKKGFFAGKFIWGLLVGILISILFNYFMLRTSITNDSTKNANKETIAQSIYNGKGNNPVNDKFNNTGTPSKKTVIHFFKPSNGFKENLASDSEDNNSIEMITDSRIQLQSRLIGVSTGNQSLENNSLNNYLFMEQPDKLFALHVDEDNRIFSIEVDTRFTWDLPKATLPMNYNSPYNNYCISIFYLVNNQFKTGIDIRHETFYVEYSGTESDSIDYRYFSQTNFTTFGAKFRYQPYEIYNFKPYIGFGIGYNKGGVAFRPLFGLEYQPNNDIIFNVGLEYTSYFYNHQNTWYNTSKFGIEYGFSINF